MNGHKDIVQSFLVAGARADLVNAKGDTALMLAVQQGHYHTAEELLKAPSSNFYQVNHLGANILHQAIASGLDAMVHNILYHDMDRRSNPDVHEGLSSLLLYPTPLVDTALQGPTPLTGLMMACQNGKLNLVKTMLRVGANVNLQTPTGETALMFASLVGRADIAELLLDAHAHANLTTTTNGFTALMMAASRGHGPVVQTLIRHARSTGTEGSLDITDRVGNSALDHAASATPPEEETAQMLVAAGIELGRRGAAFASAQTLEARARALAERVGGMLGAGVGGKGVKVKDKDKDKGESGGGVEIEVAAREGV